MQYPNEHKNIVSDLLDGRFILQGDANYAIIASEEFNEAYKRFFQLSFGIELITEPEFVYLVSIEKAKDKPARDFLIFLSVLCRELALEGKNFRKEIEEGVFETEDTELRLRQSVKWELLEKTPVIQFRQFLKHWRGRNVIAFLDNSGNRFRFTSAIQVFLNAASEIAKMKMTESA